MRADFAWICGIIAAVTFAALALLHAYWGLGGRWGMLFAPPPAWAAWLVAALLASAALVVLGRIGVWRLAVPRFIFTVGAWTLAAVFLARALGLDDLEHDGPFKRVTGTPYAHWDTVLYSPLCFFISVLCTIVASARINSRHYIGTSETSGPEGPLLHSLDARDSLDG